MAWFFPGVVVSSLFYPTRMGMFLSHVLWGEYGFSPYHGVGWVSPYLFYDVGCDFIFSLFLPMLRVLPRVAVCIGHGMWGRWGFSPTLLMGGLGVFSLPGYTVLFFSGLGEF
jgi:hypothetical protein